MSGRRLANVPVMRSPQRKYTDVGQFRCRLPLRTLRAAPARGRAPPGPHWSAVGRWPHCIDNVYTACFECNFGKGAVRLSAEGPRG